MDTTEEYPRIHLPKDFTAADEFNMTNRGLLSCAVVELQNGRLYPMFFVDPDRLVQELQVEASCGRPWFAEPNLVVLNEVTLTSVRAATSRLAESDFFAKLRPVDTAC